MIQELCSMKCWQAFSAHLIHILERTPKRFHAMLRRTSFQLQDGFIVTEAAGKSTLSLPYIPLLLITATVFLDQVNYRTQTLIGHLHMRITLNLGIVAFA